MVREGLTKTGLCKELGNEYLIAGVDAQGAVPLTESQSLQLRMRAGPQNYNCYTQCPNKKSCELKHTNGVRWRTGDQTHDNHNDYIHQCGEDGDTYKLYDVDTLTEGEAKYVTQQWWADPSRFSAKHYACVQGCAGTGKKCINTKKRNLVDWSKAPSATSTKSFTKPSTKSFTKPATNSTTGAPVSSVVSGFMDKIKKAFDAQSTTLQSKLDGMQKKLDDRSDAMQRSLDSQSDAMRQNFENQGDAMRHSLEQTQQSMAEQAARDRLSVVQSGKDMMDHLQQGTNALNQKFSSLVDRSNQPSPVAAAPAVVASTDTGTSVTAVAIGVVVVFAILVIVLVLVSKLKRRGPSRP